MIAPARRQQDLRHPGRTLPGPARARRGHRRRQLVAIAGKSGSGKSTLLNLIGGIDRATSGEVTVAGVIVNALPERALARWRGASVGVVFQFFQLLPTLTVARERDAADGFPPPPAVTRAAAARARPARPRRAWPTRPTSCRRRSPAASSSASRSPGRWPTIPPVVTADEPTGNLDSETAGAVLALFARPGGSRQDRRHRHARTRHRATRQRDDPPRRRQDRGSSARR